MKHKIIIAIGIALILHLLPSTIFAQFYKTYEEELLNDTAIIVVSGMKVNSLEQDYMLEDLAVAKGATVKVTERNGTVREKKTEAFSAKFYNGGIFYSADFPVKIDSIYYISITFNNGTTISIDDYKLDKTWKRHHYFHWTTGDKTPASILRRQKDKKSGLWCYVYSLFPLKNYKTSGGTQVK
jgi:hypothetical protein